MKNKVRKDLQISKIEERTFNNGSTKCITVQLSEERFNRLHKFMYSITNEVKYIDLVKPEERLIKVYLHPDLKTATAKVDPKTLNILCVDESWKYLDATVKMSDEDPGEFDEDLAIYLAINALERKIAIWMTDGINRKRVDSVKYNRFIGDKALNRVNQFRKILSIEKSKLLGTPLNRKIVNEEDLYRQMKGRKVPFLSMKIIGDLPQIVSNWFSSSMKKVLAATSDEEREAVRKDTEIKIDVFLKKLLKIMGLDYNNAALSKVSIVYDNTHAPVLDIVLPDWIKVFDNAFVEIRKPSGWRQNKYMSRDKEVTLSIINEYAVKLGGPDNLPAFLKETRGRLLMETIFEKRLS